MLFLLLLGSCAEFVVGRGRWLATYVGVGLAGELVGLAWQPVGGGNSVAVCGLSGVWGPLIIVGVVGCGIALQRPGLEVWRHLVPVVTVATAAVLLLARDIHGAALGVGVALAACLPVARLRHD